MKEEDKNPSGGKSCKTAGLICSFGLVILLILLDQWTKHLAVTFLKGKSGIVLLRGILELFYLENRGVAFGMFPNGRWFFIVFSLLVLAGIVFAFLRMPLSRRYVPLRAAVILLMSGAAGNLLDRCIHGFVIDFIYVSLIHFPVFNVADLYVVGGAVFLAVLLLFYYQQEEDFDFIRRK